jgi:hypothetical protein
MTNDTRLDSSQQRASRNHRIFQVRIQCGYDTLRFPDRPPPRSSTYRCPECEAPKFVTSCSICEFERSPECPLTQLLDKSSSSTKEEPVEDVEENRGQSCSCSGSCMERHYKELSARLEALALENREEHGTNSRRAPTGYFP